MGYLMQKIDPFCKYLISVEERSRKKRQLRKKERKKEEKRREEEREKEGKELRERNVWFGLFV